MDELRRHERFQAFVADAAGSGARLRAGAPARPRRAPRGARPRAARAPARGRRRARRRRRRLLVRGCDARRLPSEQRRHATSPVSSPPPHLVGERYRALDVLAAGGLVCASVAALAEGLPPLAERPAALELRVGDEPGIDGLTEALALRRLRARRPRRRARSVRRPRRHRRRLPLDRSRAAPRRAVRRRDRAGPRLLAVHAARAASGRPTRSSIPRPSGGADLVEPDLGAARTDERGRPMSRPTSSRRVDRPPDLVWQPDEVRRVAEEEGLAPLALDGAAELDPFPQAQPHAFEAQRPAVAARGLAEAENELAAFVRAGNRVVVAFAASRRGANARRRSSARSRRRSSEPASRSGAEPELRFAVAPARRGFVWRELGLVLLPDTQVFRKRPPARRPAARPGARELRRPPRRRLRRARGPRRREAARLRDEGGRERHARLPLPRVPRRGPALRPARAARQALEVHRRRRDGAPRLSKLGGKAWQNLKARARDAVRELAGELLQLYAQRQRAEGIANDLSSDWIERLEASFPYRETDDQQRAIEAVKEDLESPQPDGPARLRRRRLRQDRGRGPRGLRGRRQRAPGARPLPDDDPRRAALEHLPRALPRLPGPRRDGLAVPASRPR